MKILFAVHTYYPDKNGVQMVTEYLAEGLAKHHEVLVITEKKDRADDNVYNGVQIKRIRVYKRGFSFLGDRAVYLNLIKEWKPDVFVCVCTQVWTFDWLWGKMDDLPCRSVLYTHGYSGFLDYYPLWEDLRRGKFRAFHYHYYWKRYYDRAWKLMRKFQAVIHLSGGNVSSRYSLEHGIGNNFFMENAVEDVFFSMKEKRIGTEIRFLYVANYDDNKNHRMVLEAFAHAAIPNTSLVLAGAGEEAYYRMLCKRLDELKRVKKDLHIEIAYQITRNEVYSLFENSHVFLCGSKKEQFPLMLCEAAAASMAVVSTAVGHASSMPGLLIANTEEEMAGQISFLVKDPEMLIDRGRKLRQYAKEHYKRENKITQFEKILLDVKG